MDLAPAVLGTLESALYVDDLDAACAFYRDVMGLRPFQHAPGRHVFLMVAQTPQRQVLLLFRAEATETPPKADARFPVPPHGARGPGHYCFAAAPDQIDPWRAHLERHGTVIEAEITWPGGARSLYFRDPAGNSLEIADAAIWAGV
ncbi:MAG: VOC family protein [Paracoccus sp. (in: a-proteobacteria)]|nr:VOC family protein [Paracoccus sp. (in: a-proteobacteria)]